MMLMSVMVQWHCSSTECNNCGENNHYNNNKNTKIRLINRHGKPQIESNIEEKEKRREKNSIEATVTKFAHSFEGG